MTRLEEVLEIKKEMKEIFRYVDTFNQHQKTRIKELEDRLEEIQSSCWHTYQNITLFQTVKKICSLCDFELNG